jgi:tetratricopeptide (TPR) repeat protein
MKGRSHDKAVSLTDSDQPLLPEVPPPTVLAQLERILRDQNFVRARRMGEFLSYLVKKATAGKTNELKRDAVRDEFFGLPIDDTSRAEGKAKQRLRKLLKAYYDGPGQEDSIVIELPEWGYRLRFSERKPSECDKSFVKFEDAPTYPTGPDTASDNAEQIEATLNEGQRRHAERFYLPDYIDFTKASGETLTERLRRSRSEELKGAAKVLKLILRFGELMAAGACYRLGCLAEKRDSAETAHSYYARALRIEPDNIGYLCKDALVMQKLGEDAAAAALFERALDVGEGTMGYRSPVVLVALYGLAKSCLKSGRFEEAGPLHNKATRYGPRDLEESDIFMFANLLWAIGELYSGGGRHVDAEPLLRDALGIGAALRDVGDRTAIFVLVFHSLVQVYRALAGNGQYEDVVELGIEFCESSIAEPLEIYIVVFSLSTVAELYRDQGRDREADALSEKLRQVGGQVPMPPEFKDWWSMTFGSGNQAKESV